MSTHPECPYRPEGSAFQPHQEISEFIHTSPERPTSIEAHTLIAGAAQELVDRPEATESILKVLDKKIYKTIFRYAESYEGELPKPLPKLQDQTLDIWALRAKRGAVWAAFWGGVMYPHFAAHIVEQLKEGTLQTEHSEDDWMLYDNIRVGPLPVQGEQPLQPTGPLPEPYHSYLLSIIKPLHHAQAQSLGAIYDTHPDNSFADYAALVEQMQLTNETHHGSFGEIDDEFAHSLDSPLQDNAFVSLLVSFAHEQDTPPFHYSASDRTLAQLSRRHLAKALDRDKALGKQSSCPYATDETGPVLQRKYQSYLRNNRGRCPGQYLIVPREERLREANDAFYELAIERGAHGEGIDRNRPKGGGEASTMVLLFAEILNQQHGILQAPGRSLSSMGEK